MKFLRLSDPLLSILFEDDDIVAIDKPYGFNAHTNDSKAEHADFIQDGLIEIYEKNFGRKLHIIHRLDQTTTGVMIFGKSVESAKKYAEFFFNRQVKKTYWFLTKHPSTAQSFLIDDVIIHKGRELDAKTQLTLLKRSAPYELWQANPFTGRNHQIRIHALAAKIPILGDRAYDGASFPFLCLHNRKIEFPNGLSISSRPPVYFEDMELLSRPDLVTALFQTDRRQRLFGLNQSADEKSSSPNAESAVSHSAVEFASPRQQQALRLVHAAGTEPGFTIDQLGEVAVLNWTRSRWSPAQHEMFQAYASYIDKTVLARDGSEKGKVAAEEPPLVIHPKPSAVAKESSWIACEGEIRYELRAELGSSAGLSLSQRLQRHWVLQNARDKSVLSLFANTGGFALSAAVGGAREIIGVEASKRALTAARRNMELNALPADRIKFFCRDSLTFLDQSRGKSQQYDLVICEAPSFLKREKKIFRIKTDLEDLLKSCLLSVKPGGQLLFSTTFDDFFIQDVRQAIIRAQTALKIRSLEISNILASFDFELPDEKTALKSFLIRVGADQTTSPT